MISKKISIILDEGRDNKVLVQWIDSTVYSNGDLEVEVEYSIHTKGYGHTEENPNLIWGHYFDDYKKAKGTFQYYKSEGENFRNIVKDIEKTVNAWENDVDTWIDHESSLEFLSICNGNEDEVWTFQGDGYRCLEDEYKKSCLDSFVTFEEYVIYDSQNW